MTRSRGGELTQFDPEIERSFHRQRNTIERGDTTENSDIEEHLTIIQPTMDHVGVVERPMMEYSFPTADGTISSIALPTVQANNFEIKPSIIQIIRSSVQFSDLPEEDPNKHLSNFFEICDTFKFTGVSDDAVDLGYSRFHYVILLKIDFNLYLLVQTFYNGVTLANRATIDAATGGTIMKKLLSEAFNIIDEIATNLDSYGLEKTDKRVAGVHSVDAMTTLSAQMAALTQKVDNFGAVIWNGAPIGPCGACDQMGHLS
ncbi:UNVERIFIED_CONTAM: hypothetical protein Slati_2765400 [Sesamum latifolium]|uniref:Uncharacterized protein n=1 Tax=Sesamum latifolium TaxID=2727402 RepID=A0AAW2W0Q9_9LAMI